MTRPTIFALSFCAFFLATGILFAPLLGIENDESLFGSVIWAPPAVNTIHVAGHGIPLMLMSYLGALKGWLYAPIFRIWPPGPYSIRIPPALAGAATIWLFFLLLRRMAGERVAMIGTALLATDSLFFLTTVFDWGPVALQHLLIVAALLAIMRFLEREQSRDLAIAFFLLGLALWDKAISIWILAAMGIATLAVYPRELLRLLTTRRALTAGVSFILGASPLILYNLRSGFETFHQNSGIAPEEIPAKFGFLVESFDRGLFEWITRTGPPWPTASLLDILVVVSLALWPFVFRRNPDAARLMWFTFVVIAAGWLAMGVTRNAGSSVHHTILLWPFPELFIALALGQSWPPRLARVACTAAVAIAVGHNLFVLHSYRRDIRDRGSTQGWTESIYTLAGLAQPLPTQYFVLDWGILENLVLLRQGNLSLHAAWYPLIQPTLNDVEQNMVREWVSGSSTVFLSHMRGEEIFHGCRENLDSITRRMGLHEVTIELIKDSHGRPVFEAFRFSR